MVLNGLALCAGIGGLELGLKIALGHAYRTVCYVEREAYAAAVVVARMEDEALDTAPIWDDLESFDGGPWNGVVDIVSSGFPCQPSSTAGARKGTEDERWLWPQIARVVREVRPRYVFLENVPGLLSVNAGRAFAEILGDLATLGYDAEWDLFSVRGMGGPHKRSRLFLLARLRDEVGESDGDGFIGSGIRPSRIAGTSEEASRTEPIGAGRSHLADPIGPVVQVSPPSPSDEAGRGVASGTGRELGNSESHLRRGTLGDAGREPHDGAGHSGIGELADASGGRGEPIQLARCGGGTITEGGDMADAATDAPARHDSILERERGTRRSLGDGNDAGLEGRDEPVGESADELPPWPPSPSDLNLWRHILDIDPSLEPAIRRVVDGPSIWVDRLRTLGNAVVPIVAGVAFTVLARRLGVDLA